MCPQDFVRALSLLVLSLLLPESTRAEPEPDGTRVRRVHPGSVAEGAGLKKGDVILRVEDLPTPTVEHLAQALGDRARFESTLTMAVRRAGRDQSLTLSFPRAPPATREAAFPRRKPSGRVELQRVGNVINAKTRGVRSFRLLLSPDELDLEQPIRVTVNGIDVLNRLVSLDSDVLLRWASTDLDRTQLFAAQVTIEVPD